MELVCAYEAVIYDGGDSAPLSLKRVRGWHRGGVGMADTFKSSIKDYVSNIVEHS